MYVSVNRLKLSKTTFLTLRNWRFYVSNLYCISCLSFVKLFTYMHIFFLKWFSLTVLASIDIIFDLNQMVIRICYLYCIFIKIILFTFYFQLILITLIQYSQLLTRRIPNNWNFLHLKLMLCTRIKFAF